MRWLVIVAVGAASLSGCNMALSEAHKAAADAMRDPASARFSHESVAPTGVVCGFVDGKNGFGAYAGASPYIYQPNLKILSIYRDMLKGASIDTLLASYTSKSDFSKTYEDIDSDCNLITTWKSKCPSQISQLFSDRENFCKVFKSGFSNWKSIADRES
jgi:hypothetical protein